MSRMFTKSRREFLISDRDFEAVSAHTWQDRRVSARGEYIYGMVNGKAIALHRFIMKAPKGKTVDHINGNTFDNRRENLRLCENYQNVRNSKRYKNNTSGFRGVYIHKSGMIHSQIMVKYKPIYLGTFETVKEAAEAYKRASKKYFKKFSRVA